MKRARYWIVSPEVGHRQDTVGEGSFSGAAQCRPEHLAAFGPAEALGRPTSSGAEWPLAPTAQDPELVPHHSVLSKALPDPYTIYSANLVNFTKQAARPNFGYLRARNSAYEH